MQIWLDTVDTTVINMAKELGILFGVTTNPIILGGSFIAKQAIVSKLLEIQDGPVAVQIVGATYEEILADAIKIREFNSRLVVKIPATYEGYKCMQQLAFLDSAFMATTIVECKQILVPCVIGADYAAIYVKAVEKEAEYTIELNKMLAIIKSQNYRTKLLAASLKSLAQVMACLEMGIPAVTISPVIFNDLIRSSNTVLDYVLKFNSCK